jgi:hypothetical protein
MGVTGAANEAQLTQPIHVGELLAPGAERAR